MRALTLALLCACSPFGGNSYTAPATVGEACEDWSEAICDQLPRCVAAPKPYDVCYGDAYNICCQDADTCHAAFIGQDDPDGWRDCLSAYYSASCALLADGRAPAECQPFLE